MPFLFMASCGEGEFSAPVSPPEKAQLDPRLKGTWTYKQSDDEWILRFTPVSDTMTQLLLVIQDEKQSSSMLCQFSVSIVGQDRYMNLWKVTLDPQGRTLLSDTLILARYYFTPQGELKISYASQDCVAKVIPHKLAGVVERGWFKWGADPGPGIEVVSKAHVLATSEELRQFLKETDPAEFFEPLGTFRRAEGDTGEKK